MKSEKMEETKNISKKKLKTTNGDSIEVKDNSKKIFVNKIVKKSPKIETPEEKIFKPKKTKVSKLKEEIKKVEIPIEKKVTDIKEAEVDTLKGTSKEKSVEEAEINKEEQAGEEERKTTEKATSQLIVFNLGDEEYGVLMEDVKEIIKTVDITPIPQLPEFIEGLINLRGKVISVINLRKRFLLEEEKEFLGKNIIITEVNENILGVLVDKVTEILKVASKEIKKAPAMPGSKISLDYIKGVVIIESEKEEKQKPKRKSKLKEKGPEVVEEEKQKPSRLIVVLNINKLLSEEELGKLAESAKKSKRIIKSRKKPSEEEKDKEKIAVEEKEGDKPIGEEMEKAETSEEKIFKSDKMEKSSDEAEGKDDDAEEELYFIKKEKPKDKEKNKKAEEELFKNSEEGTMRIIE